MATGNLTSVSSSMALPQTSADAQAPQRSKFKDVWNDIQAKMGEKPKEKREAKKTLDKDDFLKIMITQMQHQDPTKPFDMDKMATEMAQITSVEQLKNLNSKMDKLVTTDRPSDRLALINLIGKTVSVDKSRFPHKEGQNETLQFSLPAKSDKTIVSLMSEKGEVILQKDLGPLEAGSNSFIWDGKKVNTLPADAGTYMIRVEAFTNNGHQIPTSTISKERIIGVSFDGPEPALLVGDHQSSGKVLMSHVLQIDSDSFPAVAQAANPANGETKIIPSPQNNFIHFEKGKGSSNLDLSKAAPEVKQAVAEFQKQIAAVPQEKGFPNGLGEASNSEKGGESE